MTKYNGLYGDGNVSPDADFVFLELLETRSPKFGWKIKPHLHPGLLQVFFIDKGEFVFFEAEGKKQLQAPCLLLIPSTALHGFNFNEDVTGRILTLTESYYDNLISEVQALSPGSGRVICITKISDSYSPECVSSILKTIDHEIALHEPGKHFMLRVCMQQLFLVIHRIALQKAQQYEEINNQASRYYRGFQKLIRKNGGIATIKNLAYELGISPVHLNRVCKQMTGKPAGTLLQEHIIGEAKKYLTYTSYSVSEIAYILHFEYPNYFAKFFRKHAGLSPKAYRPQKPATD